jgi:hypothetical protein
VINGIYHSEIWRSFRGNQETLCFFDPLVNACGKVNDIKAAEEIPKSAGDHAKEEGYMMTDMALAPMIDLS